MVPISEEQLIIDVIGLLKLPLIIVAAALEPSITPS